MLYGKLKSKVIYKAIKVRLLCNKCVQFYQQNCNIKYTNKQKDPDAFDLREIKKKYFGIILLCNKKCRTTHMPPFPGP